MIAAAAVSDKKVVVFVDNFSELQLYVVFEFADSGRDLETVEVSRDVQVFIGFLLR